MRRLIRTDGTSVDLPNPLTNREVASLIGAETLDTVSLRHLGEPLHVMLVDDGGYETKAVEHSPGHIELKPIRARKAVNWQATTLYHLNCLPGTTHQIVGDVVVALDEDFA